SPPSMTAARNTLLLAVFVTAASAVAAEADWVRVVEASDAGVVLELAAPPPRGAAGGYRVDGFDADGEAGVPVSVQRTAWLALPESHGARLEILALERRDLGRLDWPRQPAVLSLRERHASDAAAEFRAVEPRAFRGEYPATAVSLGSFGRRRGRDVAA